MTPHPRLPARARPRRRRSHPWAARDTPVALPPAHPRDCEDLSPPPPAPASARSSCQITGALAPAGRAPPPGEGSLRALPEPGSRRSPFPAHSHYSCKVNPRRVTAARPRMCAFLGQAPQSPPSSAPSSRRRVPGSAGDGTSRESCKMSTPRAKRGGRSQGRAGPPGPLHFYRRRKRARLGRRSPRLSGPRAWPAPVRSPPLPSSGSGARAAPRLPAGDLVSPPVLPAFRLARRRPGAGRPDSARGAVRKWPPGQAPRRRPGRPPAPDPQWPQPGPGPALGRACRSRARAPCPRAQPGPPGSAPPHLPPQVRALPLSPVPAVPSTPRVSSGGDVAAFLVAARPPTRLLAHGASGLGVIPLVAKRKKRGTRNWGPGGGDCQKHWLLFPPRAAALLPPAPNHLWRVSGPHSALAPPGASLLPGGWRSQPSPPLGMEVWKIPALRLRATPLTPPCTS